MTTGSPPTPSGAAPSTTIELAVLVREMLRTLGRMPPTPLTQTYWQILSEIAIERYGDTMRAFAHPRLYGVEIFMISPERRAELREWLTHSPQFAFSLIVGLMSDDEDAAWGFAYG